jgi:hypothetical protein
MKRASDAALLTANVPAMLQHECDEMLAIAQNKKSGPKGLALRVEMIMSARIIGKACAICKRDFNFLSSARLISAGP